MKSITVYEHQTLTRDDGLSKTQLAALQSFYGNGKDFPYYKLIHRGIKFRSYVGVIRVGNLTIEVLPKADDSSDDTTYWRDRLFDMLRVVHDLPLHSPSAAQLQTRAHDVLHLYLRILLELCERLYRRGLHRAYRTERANAAVLSGRLLFTEQLRYNLVHKERFFVARDRFDFDTPLNRILRQALQLASRLNGLRTLQPRFQQLLECWPGLPGFPVSPAIFNRLRFPRGTEQYRPAIAIARLILLQHAPTGRGGRDLPTLMFNMNQLWEAFLECTLRRHLENYVIRGQDITQYYHTEDNNSVSLRPDIIISKQIMEPPYTYSAVIDAKWKVPFNARPSAGDLQQMYTYVHFLRADRVALVYPGRRAGPQVQGWFGEAEKPESGKPCCILFLPLPTPEEGCSEWMEKIAVTVRGFLE